MTIFESMWADIQDPAIRHAIVVHLPVALAMLGPIFVLLMIIQPKNAWLRWIAIGCYALLAATAWYATDTGKASKMAIDTLMSTEAAKVLSDHEWYADWAWKIGIAVVVVLLFTNIKKPAARNIAFVFSAIGALAITGWVSVTGHYGGTLVYQYGINTGEDIISRPDENDSDQQADHDDNGDMTEPVDPQIVFLREQVRPILEANCWNCHSGDRENAGGGLVLTSLEDIMQGGQGGPAIVVGDPDASLLIEAVRFTDPFLQMPPGEEHRLSDEEVDILEKWVEDGAAWEPVGFDQE